MLGLGFVKALRLAVFDFFCATKTRRTGGVGLSAILPAGFEVPAWNIFTFFGTTMSGIVVGGGGICSVLVTIGRSNPASGSTLINRVNGRGIPPSTSGPSTSKSPSSYATANCICLGTRLIFDLRLGR